MPSVMTEEEYRDYISDCIIMSDTPPKLIMLYRKELEDILGSRASDTQLIRYVAMRERDVVYAH
jgi:hypothetical protein